MAYPKISALLNNCPMHFLTPEIVQECLKRGSDGSYSRPQDDVNYERLKQTFAATYLEGKEISWPELAELLRQYNPFDQQIILGPVLRQFMADSMKVDHELPAFFEDKAGLEAYIRKMSEPVPELQNRFHSAGPHEISTFVAAPLGIMFTYHRAKESPKTLPHIALQDPVGLIDVYHEGDIGGAGNGGHWERTDNKLDRVDYEKEADSRLGSVVRLLKDNPSVTRMGLDLLKQHVRRMYESVSTGLDRKNEIEFLDVLALQLSKYATLINAVPKEIAIQIINPEPDSLLLELITQVPDFIGEYSPEIIASVKNCLRLREQGKPYILQGISQLNEIVNSLMEPVQINVPGTQSVQKAEEEELIRVMPSSPPLPRASFFNSNPSSQPARSQDLSVPAPLPELTVIDLSSIPAEEKISSNSGEQDELLTAPVFDLELISPAPESEKETTTPGMPGPLSDKLVLDEFEDLITAINAALSLPITAQAICQVINLANELQDKIVETIQKRKPSVAVNRESVEEVLTQLKSIYPAKLHFQNREQAQMWRACVLELTKEYAPKLFRSATQASTFGNNLVSLLDLTTDVYVEVESLTMKYRNVTEDLEDLDYFSSEYQAHLDLIVRELPKYQKELDDLSKCPKNYKPIVTSAVKSVMNYIELPPLARLRKLHENLMEAINSLEQFKNSIDPESSDPLKQQQLKDINHALLKFNASQTELDDSIKFILETGNTHNAGLLLVKYSDDLKKTVQDTVLDKPSLSSLHSTFEKFTRLILKILSFGIYEYKSKPRQAIEVLDSDQLVDISSGINGPSAS
ncbi:hypothetical protein B1207_05645 [Legionella quinlivanii]|uniref:Uncharacterized protein n=1 Tax=Legionella quinlivanii TaxID=45073 RepID=A0A364LKF7_9GAMM|nr:hypothetical protein [Legionella quinlivanii]RAP36915.1 hypothetical protein B1207_05645 [Legionella quinlivanii]